MSYSILNAVAANAVVKLFAKEKTLKVKIVADQDAAIQRVIDGLILSCDVPKDQFCKGTSANNPARAEVKEMFEAIREAGGLSASAVANYQVSFWIAFRDGVPFERGLFNQNKDKTAKPDNTAKKAGKVKETTRAELDKTLTKALEQARLLGLNEFAATLLDHCLESLDGFKEETK